LLVIGARLQPEKASASVSPSAGLFDRSKGLGNFAPSLVRVARRFLPPRQTEHFGLQLRTDAPEKLRRGQNSLSRASKANRRNFNC
jgi:hypothetical protein